MEVHKLKVGEELATREEIKGDLGCEKWGRREGRESVESEREKGKTRQTFSVNPEEGDRFWASWAGESATSSSRRTRRAADIRRAI